MSDLHIGVICTQDSRRDFYVFAMGRPAVDAIARRAQTGFPVESDRMPSDDDSRLASEFHVASNSLGEAEIQAGAENHADCE